MSAGKLRIPAKKHYSIDVYEAQVNGMSSGWHSFAPVVSGRRSKGDHITAPSYVLGLRTGCVLELTIK